MKHAITYQGADSDWFEALPLGNGKFGCMIYFHDSTLKIVFNHYDIYYQDIAEKHFDFKSDYQQDKEKLASYPFDELSKDSYNQTLHPVPDNESPLYGMKNTSKTAELEVAFAEKVQLKSLTLQIDEAVIELMLSLGGQTCGITMFIPEERDAFILHSHTPLHPFISAVHLKLDAEEKNLNITEAEKNILVQEGQMPYLSLSADGAWRACEKKRTWVPLDQPLHILFLEMFSKPTQLPDFAKMYDEHLAFWQDFWHSRITLPDKFLETLWYLYLYLIKASNGTGSVYSEQAAGLNGLWDAKNHSLWGSMWYWDVNIQSTFWSVFSANHLELAKRFCDSYLAHQDNIHAYTKAYYGKEGWAIDYPHHFYNCIQPWCAQFLFWYYEYSNDGAFLEKAVSVFQEQCDFVLDTFKVTDDKLIFPDISPEQGPVTADSSITIASVKYLFSFTIDALKILQKKVPQAYESFLAQLPEYARTKEQPVRLLDSPYTDPDQWLRHPSVLMPIFPVREKDYISGGRFEEIAENTIDFAHDNCEIGMFGPTWIASAYAQAGAGDKVLQTLYELGIDHYTHANGLPYEETERWINLAMITKPPIYLPAMMEPMGGLTCAVNEMLLQSDGEKIKLFPALPKGEKVFEKKIYSSEKTDREMVRKAWKDCTFHNLLVKGGHQVSGQVTDGKINWVKITSGKAGAVRLCFPDHLAVPSGFPAADIRLTAGETKEWGLCLKERDAVSYPLRQESAAHRQIFLGKNKETEYYKKLDAMTRPYLQGNTYQYPMTVYKFDFGNPQLEKDSTADFHRQINLSAPKCLLATGYRRVGIHEAFSREKRYGFTADAYLSAAAASGPDVLRKDCLLSEKKSSFLLDIPPGKYTFLFGIGGAVSSSTCIKVKNFIFEKKLAENEFAYEEMTLLHDGGLLEIAIESREEAKWALNFLILNKERSCY